MEQFAKNWTSFLAANCRNSAWNFDDNPKIAMKLKMSKFQEHIFVCWELFWEKGTVIAVVEISEGWWKSSKYSRK